MVPYSAQFMKRLDIQATFAKSLKDMFMCFFCFFLNNSMKSKNCYIPELRAAI